MRSMYKFGLYLGLLHSQCYKLAGETDRTNQKRDRFQQVKSILIQPRALSRQLFPLPP